MQPTFDLILNMSIFIWLGAVCPWRSFIDGSVIPLSSLILLAVLILLLRRLPTIYLMRRFIPQLRNSSDALFMGFFGPIGISAIFYCYLGMEYLQNSGGEIADSSKLMEQIHVVVWFLVASSIVSGSFVSMGFKANHCTDGTWPLHTPGPSRAILDSEDAKEILSGV